MKFGNWRWVSRKAKAEEDLFAPIAEEVHMRIVPSPSLVLTMAVSCISAIVQAAAWAVLCAIICLTLIEGRIRQRHAPQPPVQEQRFPEESTRPYTACTACARRLWNHLE